MAAPAGLSDILSLAETASKIYHYWQGVPEDLSGLLHKFDYLEKQLRSLSTVIVSSGWSMYDKSAELEALFKDAEVFFVKQKTLAETSAGGASKTGKITRRKLDEDEMQRIAKSVDDQMRTIQDFKTNVMLLASVRSLQASRTTLQRQSDRASRPGMDKKNLQSARIVPLGRPQEFIEEARADSNAINVITEAITALQFAMKLKHRNPTTYQPNLETIIAFSPEVVALPSTTDHDMIEDFVVESAQLVEKLQLYTEAAAPTEHFDELEAFVAKANNLTRDLQPSKAGMSAEVRSLHLPAIEPSPQSYSDSFLRNPEFQRWAASPSDVPLPLPARDQVSFVLGKPARPVTRSTSTQTGSDAGFSMRSPSFSEGLMEVGGPAKEHIDLTGWVKIYAGKQTDSQRISCKLDITRSEGSTCIWAVATSRRRSSALAATTIPSAMTPGMLMHGQQIEFAAEGIGTFRTFQHSFTNVIRPVPHILHPSVEGSNATKAGLSANDAVFSITFHDPQYFVEEGCPPKWTRELQYVFSNESDRNRVRSKIFGKRLVHSAGTESIKFGYIACTQHAITLWEDEITRIRTLTFYRDPPTNTSRPPGDVEYKVLGITDLKKAEKDNEPLPLNVEQINQNFTPVAIANRPSGGPTTVSAKTTKARSRDDMSCSIYFSELKDKKEFVRILRQRTPS